MRIINNKYAKNIEYNNNSNTCVLIFHGFASTPYDMKNLAKTMSEQGYDVYVPLLPYHGQTYLQLLEFNLTEIFEWGKEKIAQKRSEYKTLIIIGVSIGSAMMYVSEISDPSADILIGLSTGGVFSFGLRLFSFISRVIKIKFLPYSPIKDLELKYLDQGFLNWKKTNFEKMPMNLFVQAVRRSKYLNRKAKQITKPLLIINGSKDPATSKKATPYFINDAQNKIKLGVTVKGAGHLLLNTKYHEIVTEEILNFIAKCQNLKPITKTNQFKTIKLNVK